MNHVDEADWSENGWSTIACPACDDLRAVRDEILAGSRASHMLTGEGLNAIEVFIEVIHDHALS